MRLRHAVDKNQAAIVDALRQAGATVTDTSAVGHGYPDLTCGFRGTTYLIEIKSERGTLTADEREWFAAWHGHAAIVYSPEDALQAIGAVHARRRDVR